MSWRRSGAACWTSPRASGCRRCRWSSTLLSTELKDRARRSLEWRTVRAQLGRFKRMADFDKGVLLRGRSWRAPRGPASRSLRTHPLRAKAPTPWQCTPCPRRWGVRRDEISSWWWRRRRSISTGGGAISAGPKGISCFGSCTFVSQGKD